MCPIALTTPIQPAPETSIVIVNALVTLEPNVSIAVTYASADGQGNPIPQTSATVQLGGPAMVAFGNTAGGFKAKLYVALQTQVPALAGTVS